MNKTLTKGQSCSIIQHTTDIEGENYEPDHQLKHGY